MKEVNACNWTHVHSLFVAYTRKLEILCTSNLLLANYLNMALHKIIQQMLIIKF